jgi:transposase
MSRARLVITAVVLEGRGVREVARDYGVSPGWVSRLVARYRADGEAAFESRSRRPATSPRATPPEVLERIVELRRRLVASGDDAGPETIRWHLAHHFGVNVSTSTIARTLTRAGLVTPQPHKRPRSSYIRFEADLPNETWQSDFTHYRLADGSDVEILTFLDDHARFALSVTAHRHVTGPIVLAEFRTAVPKWGIPASTLTDIQRHRLHRAVRRRPQRPRDRAAPPRGDPEELPAEPPDDMRKGRAVPADDEALARRAAEPARHDRRAPAAPRSLRRPLQRGAAAPLAIRAIDAVGRLSRSAEGRSP